MLKLTLYPSDNMLFVYFKLHFQLSRNRELVVALLTPYVELKLFIHDWEAQAIVGTQVNLDHVLAIRTFPFKLNTFQVKAFRVYLAMGYPSFFYVFSHIDTL